MNRRLLLVTLLMVLTACRTVNVNHTNQKTIHDQVLLGSIGLVDNSLFQTDFNNSAFPEYKQPIKVNYSINDFNKKTFVAFLEANEKQGLKLNIKYVDSLKEKPKFLTLSIADKVGVLNALNYNENKDVNDYLANNVNAKIVSTISIALPQNLIDEITKSEEVFLVQDSVKNYALQLYSNGETSSKIQFNSGVVFTCQTSSFCWKENDKHQINIVDFVDRQSSCPNKTYKSAKRAKKKINYLKF